MHPQPQSQSTHDGALFNILRQHTLNTAFKVTNHSTNNVGILTAAEFRREHMRPNLPCILSRESVEVDQWRAAKEWRIPNLTYQQQSSQCATTPQHGTSLSTSFTSESFHDQLLLAKRLILSTLPPPSSSSSTPSSSANSLLPPVPSRPNFARLKELFKSMTQPVLVARVFANEDPALANASSSESMEQQTSAYGSNTHEEKMEMFLQQWEIQSAKRYQAQLNTNDEKQQSSLPPSSSFAASSSSSPQLSRYELKYLKDWHLVQTYPHYEAYHTPAHFLDDWMNYDSLKYLQSQSTLSSFPPPSSPSSSSLSSSSLPPDDFRFCYAGAGGTWTPMHSDVYNSYSWSANIVGRKLWIMLAPEWRKFISQQSGEIERWGLGKEI